MRIKITFKIVQLLLILQMTCLFSQVDTRSVTVDLRQKVINSNFKNFNSYLSNGVNKQNLLGDGDFIDGLETLPYSADSNSRFLEFGNNLYTGNPDINIPLFSINDGNIEIPINIVYHSRGIKVDQKASEVGLGWSLINVPQIYRKVNIINDWFQEDNEKKPVGYFRKIRENLPPYFQNTYVSENSPDEYLVNLKGDTKKFIFINESTPVELTNTGAKIQATSYNFPNFSVRQPKDFNQFEITDNDGLLYTFIDGGFRSGGSTILELVSQGQTGTTEEKSVAEWKVSKISDPINNKSVDIEYFTSPLVEEYVSLSENSSVQFNSGIFGSIPYERNAPLSVERWPYFLNYLVTHVDSKKYISKITYSAGKLVFNYEDFILSYDNTGYSPVPTYVQKVLKSIEQYDNYNKLIKSYTFVYGHFSCLEQENDLDLCAQRLKLISVEESNAGKYEFSYNNLPLYSYTSNKNDYLGYHTNAQINDHSKGLYYYPYNNEWSILPFNLPIPPYDPINQTSALQKIKIFNNDQSSNGYGFELKALPFSNYAKAGILEKIKFPTGAEQYFEYEPNDFILFGQFQEQGAGLRLKESYIKDGNVIQKKTKYEYKDPVTNKSSGLLLAPPFLGFPRMYFEVGGNFTEIMDEENSFISAYTSLFNKSNSGIESTVGYSKVIRRYDDGSSEEFDFKNKNNDYDLTTLNYTYNSLLSGVPSDYSYGSFRNQNSAALIKYKNFEIYGNGNLLKKTIRDKLGGIKQTIVNEYRNKKLAHASSLFPYYTPPSYSNKFTYGSYKLNYDIYFNDLINSIKTEYFPSGNKVETTSYTYINNYSKRLKTVSSSLGVSREKKYLFENTYTNGSPEYNLLNTYNVKYALESEKTYLNGIRISSQNIKYGNFPVGQYNIPRISEIYTETLKSNIKNSHKIISYSNKGHIRETLTNGLSKVTIWGYNDNFPIAEIIGATYSEVSPYITNIVNKSNLDIDPTTENDLITYLDAFRAEPQLKNFLITTYTYNPLIGITSVTPPSGMREIYIYDLVTNKLKEVKRLEKDSGGNNVYRTLNQYEYHYKP